MIALILMVWILIQLHAPMWCYAVLALDAIVKLMKGAYNAGKNVQDQN